MRWGYQIASGALAYSGWNIDDVRILGTTNAKTPTATPQTLPVTFGTATPVTLAGVDTNSPVQPLAFNLATSPQHGTLSGTVPNLTYTPAIGFAGTDTFTFTCTNTYNLTSAPATVTLHVSPGTPVANSQRVNVPINTPTGFVISGTDPDVPPLTLSYAVQSQPSHGTLSGTAPNLTYSPASNFQGTDSFTFNVSNGASMSAASTISRFFVGETGGGRPGHVRRFFRGRLPRQQSSGAAGRRCGRQFLRHGAHRGRQQSRHRFQSNAGGCGDDAGQFLRSQWWLFAARRAGARD